MSNIINFSAGIELLHAAEKIVIVTHINPDGDAIGSALALYDFAVANGKNAHIFISESATPPNLKFLANSNRVKEYNPQLHDRHVMTADVIFMLDFNDITRIKTLDNAVTASNARKVMIDHHIGHEDIADIYLVNSNASSTGELIYYFIRQARGKITRETAEAIYTAIMTDTGNFRFSNTSADVLRIAADLVDCGANPSDIYDEVYNQNTIHQLKLLGQAYNSLELHLSGRLATMTITNDIMKQTDTNDKDVTGYSDKTLAVRGTQVGALFVEIFEKHEIRVSLRSRGDIDVRNIAAKHDGGGHINAAGLRLRNITIENAKSIIINDIKDALSKHTN